VCDTDMVFRFGPTVPSTEDIGKTIELMVLVAFGTQMVTSSRVSLKMTNQTAKAPTPVRMEQFIRAWGSMMCSTARARQFGQMDRVLLATTSKERRMALEHTAGPKEISIRESGKTT